MLTFQELYESYFGDVFRFSLWLSRDESEAEDLASETFVRAWSHRHRLRTETLKAYLLAIARNAHLDSRRRSRRIAELPEEMPDSGPSPHREATAKIDLDRIRSAMAAWSEPDRAALVLRAEQGLSYGEIARVLGISEGAARVKVYRGRRKLLDLYRREKRST